MTRVVYLTLIRIDDDFIELYVIVHNLDTQSLGSWGSLGRIWAGCGHIRTFFLIVICVTEIGKIEY